MNRKLFITLDCIILLAMLGSALGIVDQSQAARFSPQTADLTKEAQPIKASIDVNIPLSLERQGTARVLVILQQQADLSGASRLQTKDEKGAYVYRQLTSIAAQTQAPLRLFLDAREADYKAYWIQNMFMVTVDARLLDELANQPGIARIESYSPPIVESFEHTLGPDYGMEFGPPLPGMESNQSGGNLEGIGTAIDLTSPTTVEWNIQRVGADDVWALGFTGQGVVVGSLDSGVEWTHPALVNHYRPQIPGAPGRHDYNWFDGVGGSLVPVDYSYHGTVTMGPIVGDDGVGNQIGMAPGAYWIACPGVASPYIRILDCLQWFLAPTKLDGTDPRPDLAPDVINNSWGSASDFHAAFQALYTAGIFSTNIVGNGGPDCNTTINPGQWSEVTAAGAFGQGDIIGDFSGRGLVIIGHEQAVKPDIAAPGVDVRSSIPERFGGGYYPYCTGTSMAAPHVSGAAALLISVNPELRGHPDLLQMLLKTNAEPRPTTECTPGGGVPNNVWGWGILNVYNSVLAAQQLEWGAIEGLVVEAGTQNPIVDVRLTFTDTTLDWPYHEASADLGDYGHILPAGSYDITASRYAYLDSLINGVVISVGITTTQDIEMSLAPIWTVLGVVTDSLTGEPLPASIVLESTPVSTQTDPETGGYSAQAAQGEWWLVVTSPGYAEEAIKITLDQDRVENFSLDPVINYYMRRSVDGECGAQFDWLDATSGTSLSLNDDDFGYVAIPNGRTLTFYGNSYNAIYAGSNGILTFGAGSRIWSVSIPNPSLPNNGIYAFSTDLDPSGGYQGIIYTKYIDNRYFVIEWYQVEHFPEGEPETFEIILDLDTNIVKIQYLTVSDPSDVVAGVENATGTEATQYAYDDPALVTNNTAVEFYPVFGLPPPSGGAGMLTGAVTDAHTSLPIEGAVVTAVAFTPPRETSTYTTDISGTYSASLCADWYDVMAGAVGYAPGEEVRVSVYPDEQTIQDFTLTAYISPTAVSITGPVEGWAAIPYTFTAAVEPITTTLPLTYTWQLGGQIPITHTGGLSDTNDFIWDMPGTQLITVTASNLYGSVSDTHPITITDVPIEGLAASNDSPTLFGEATTFTAVITSGTNVLFAWDFGDGFGGDGAVITHTYSSSGLFTATVTATNTTNSTSDTTQVTIIAPNYPTYLPLVIKTSETPLAPSSALPEGGMLMGLVILSIIGRWRRRG